MAYNNNKPFNKERYYNNKPRFNDPQLPKAGPTPSHFADTAEYTNTDSFKTAYQKKRSYDVEISKVDVSVVGAANIYGKLNNRKSFVFSKEEYGLYTGALNNLFANDQFHLLSTISRRVSVLYHGIPTSKQFQTADEAKKALQIRAVKTWVDNVNTLITQLTAAQFTDLGIFSAQYSPVETSYYRHFLSHPLQYILVAYQQELMFQLYTIQSFLALTSALPKLQEIYYSKADYFVTLQNDLKRSRYTSKINQALIWMKKRFIDKIFYSQYFAPATVMSKRTDGLNSPIIYLVPVFPIGLEAVACKQNNYVGQKFDASEFDFIQKFSMLPTIRNDDNYPVGVGSKDHYFTNIGRIQDAFSVDTILDIILKPNETKEQINVKLKAWLSTAEKVINELIDAQLAFSANQTVISLEAALAKLSASNSGINWSQNTSFSEMAPIMEFTDWEFVNELALFSATRYTTTANGYEMAIPMYKNKGMPKQIRLEYFQAFYMPSDETYLSYYKLGDTLRVKFRDNTDVYFRVNRTTESVTFDVVGSWTSEDVITANEEYVATAFQDSFPAVRYKRQVTGKSRTKADPEIVTWRNPELMTYLKVAFTNRAAELEVNNVRNFLIPLA